MAETRYCILETQGQMCVSVSGYIFLLLLLQWNQNTFLHVSNRFSFQESLFPQPLTCVYVAEMQNLYWKPVISFLLLLVNLMLQ